ncbi:MAG: hypothetical protein ACE5PO_02545 [Candidatus Bathyarchaeia archaeon]
MNRDVALAEWLSVSLPNRIVRANFDKAKPAYRVPWITLSQANVERQKHAIIAHLEMLKAELEAYSKLIQVHTIEIHYHAEESGDQRLQDFSTKLQSDLQGTLNELIGRVEANRKELGSK